MESDSLNSIGLGFIIAMSLLLLALPRRYALWPIFCGLCYMTLGQAVIVAGLHFYVLRLLILFGWVRIIIRNELSLASLRFTAIDKAIVAWLIAETCLYTASHGMTMEALVYRLGAAYNVLGLYGLFRILIRDHNDIVRAVAILAVLVAPLAMLMLYESLSGVNVFSIFGGVSLVSGLREGSVRSQGPFLHPILAGTFGATLIPLFASLWVCVRKEKMRIYRIGAAIGLVCAHAIMIGAHSSGPLMAYMAIIIGILLWPMRKRMYVIRWAIIGGVVMLQLAMEAPVWYLIERLGNLTGASGHGWYRSALIDAAMSHVGEWWLAGTNYTANWGLPVLPTEPDMVDMTNQYLHVGVKSGLPSLILFVIVIYYAFRAIGEALNQPGSPSMKKYLWCLGVALLGHVIAFINVAYFDQLIAAWCLVLAFISVATRAPERKKLVFRARYSICRPQAA